MRKILLCPIILLVNLTVFSQTIEKGWSADVAFSDGTVFASESNINKENLRLSPNNINIYKKVFQGKLRDIGKSPLQISKNTLTAISGKNSLLARQIRRHVNGYYGFEQNGKEITVFGLSSIGNEGKLYKCVQNQNCKLECRATIIQLKVKDNTENLILVTAMRFLKE